MSTVFDRFSPGQSVVYLDSPFVAVMCNLGFQVVTIKCKSKRQGHWVVSWEYKGSVFVNAVSEKLLAKIEDIQ